MQQQTTNGYAKRTFLLAFLIAAAVFLPFVIIDKGYFIYYGDFNVQQIPFYKLAHEAVRSGDIFWNWYTDLGANFIGSYSFYLLFSPFFWITLPFKTSFLPYLMAPLLVLKTACAALSAYMYLKRFVKDAGFAVIGGLFYAFSGWMDFNIFFNHFHEVAVFFPLLLIGVEKIVMEDKKAFFAFAVAVNAIVNYWFFVGEVVFVILYFAVRLSDASFRMTAKKFVYLALEAVLGVGMAAFVLLPSVLALMGNPRTGLDELTTGWNAWLYWHEQRQPAILQSLLFPPDLPARPNFFPDHGAKWASLSAWLPMIGITGVLAYFFERKNDWVKKLLAICLLLSLVPWLNSLFVFLNNSYYARWFYMPVLIMAMASIRSLEDSVFGAAHYKRAIKWVGIITAAFVIMCAVTPKYDDEELKIGLAKDLPLTWVYAGIAFLGLFCTAVLVLRLRHRKKFIVIMTAAVAIFSIAFTTFYIASGKEIFERSEFVINTAISGRDKIKLPDDTFARSDAFDAQDNLLMFWHLPNIQAFHSIVPVSIMEFYPEVGVKRDVGSRPEPEFYALRSLLSVRWLFIEDSEDKDQNPMPGYTKYDTQAGFNIYENDNFIPMGFCYDKCITPVELEEVTENQRSNMMLEAVVLDDDAIARNSDILEHTAVTKTENFSAEKMAEDAKARRKFTADTFTVNKRGFTATTNLDGAKLMFFSVPLEKGWTASVNGAPTRIEKANIGFMAVRVPAGRSIVRFEYMTPGLLEGLLLSGLFLIVFAVYVILARRSYKKALVEIDVDASMLTGQSFTMSFEEFDSRYGGGKDRIKQIQEIIDASANNFPESLNPDEKTLHFSKFDANTNQKSDDNQNEPQ